MKKINLFDIVIVLIIIAIGVIGGFYVSGRNAIKTQSITFDVIVEDITKETASQLEIGEKIFNSSNNKEFGTIQDIEINEYQVNFFDQNEGCYKMITKPDYYTLNLTVKAEAVKNEDSFSVADVSMVVGSRIFLKGQNYVCIGRISGFKEVK